MNKKALDLLYRSFDGKLSEEEQRQLEDALDDLPALRKEKERIAAMRGAISASAAKSFRPFFVERVMRRIASIGEKKRNREMFFESLQFAFRRVAVVGAMVIVILVAYNFVKTGDLSVTGVFGMPQETLEEVLELPFDSTLEELL
jgi:anti-sigma factor RsiW